MRYVTWTKIQGDNTLGLTFIHGYFELSSKRWWIIAMKAYLGWALQGKKQLLESRVGNSNSIYARLQCFQLSHMRLKIGGDLRNSHREVFKRAWTYIWCLMSKVFFDSISHLVGKIWGTSHGTTCSQAHCGLSTTTCTRIPLLASL